jgi:hypothetical protein
MTTHGKGSSCLLLCWMCLRNLKKQNTFDVYLNLCEGYEEPEYSGLDVVLALEKLNLPFTGADSRFYEPTREEMQSAAEGAGLDSFEGSMYQMSARWKRCPGRCDIR